MNDKQYLNLVADIGKILLDHIKSAGKYDELLITYGDVAKQLPYEFNARNLDRPLGTLSDYCLELGLPLISTIVVNKEERMPGPGYFKAFFPQIKESRWLDIFVEQYKRVKACRNWKPLAKKLGLK